MSDTSNTDGIAWWQSHIIWKQVILAVCTLAAGAGYAISPEQQDNIIAGCMGIATLASTIIAIYDRVKRPCPPIIKQPTGVTP